MNAGEQILQTVKEHMYDLALLELQINAAFVWSCLDCQEKDCSTLTANKTGLGRRPATAECHQVLLASWTELK